MRRSLHLMVILIAAGCLVGVAAGLCCAHQDEEYAKQEGASLERPRTESSAEQKQKKSERPWLHINGAPPTRLHYCLFFGAWGGVIGVLLAAGGSLSVTLPVGVFGGLLGLMIERAAVGLMVTRGFIQAHDPKLARNLLHRFPVGDRGSPPLLVSR